MGFIRKADLIILAVGLFLIWGLFAMIMGNDFRPEMALPQTIVLVAIVVVIWITRAIRGR